MGSGGPSVTLLSKDLGPATLAADAHLALAVHRAERETQCKSSNLREKPCGPEVLLRRHGQQHRARSRFWFYRQVTPPGQSNLARPALLEGLECRALFLFEWTHVQRTCSWKDQH